MNAAVERTIDARVAAAFDDLLGDIGVSTRQEILQRAGDMVRAVWTHKVYAALPKDKTTVAEYFLDAELEHFLNEAIEECYGKIVCLRDRARGARP